MKGRLPKNVADGAWIAAVERLGHVPPCVRDAFSWLPHPYGQPERGRSAGPGWFWESYDPPFDVPPSPALPSSARCHSCVFQEPVWSQGYAGCSHSWLDDSDGDCRAFLDRSEFLQAQPTYRRFCVPPPLAYPEMAHRPYWRDGRRWSDFDASANLPSAYRACLNMPLWWASGASAVYGAIERERWRRFHEWAARATMAKAGAYQMPLFGYRGRDG